MNPPDDRVGELNLEGIRATFDSENGSRYTPSHGGRSIIDVWTAHVQSQPDMVVYTTWNDLGEHHYVGPYNLEHTGYQRSALTC